MDFGNLLKMSTFTQRQKYIGKVFAVLAAIAWGVSGNFAQFAFEKRQIDPEWLVTMRLLISGFILLGMAGLGGKNIFEIWKDRKRALRLLVFGCIGMLGVQYTYLAAIQASNAATATILQYLGPVFIAVYYSWSRKQLPTRIEMVAITLALLGTALMVTHGDVSTLTLTPAALILGLLSALTLAIYSIQPIPLLKQYDSSVVVGWGMITGGILISCFRSPMDVPGTWDVWTFVSVGFIVFIASLFAFYIYLKAIHRIGAGTASLLACAEPLSAALVAVRWMGVQFSMLDWIGAVMIVSTIALLSVAEQGKK